MKLFLFIYSLIITIYYLYTIYLLPYYLSIYQYFTKVVSYYFYAFIFLPYYFFAQKLCCIGVFVSFLSVFLLKNRKKSANFLQFFLSVYQ